jgi:glucose/arabinose dehydrogenase
VGRVVDPQTRRRVLVIAKEAPAHNGGHLVFGPDGLLYIGTGDGRFPGDPDEVARDPRSLLGKIQRIDPRDPDGPGRRRYRVPTGNPFVGRPGKDEIWARGLRNPWRFSFDRVTGDLWIGDVGEDEREEIDKASSRANGRGAGRGDDYGWDDCEGSLEFEDDEGDSDTDCEQHVLPIFEYAHADGGACSVTGGSVHRRAGPASWHGLYIAGDFCGRLFVLGPAGRLRLSTSTSESITSFGSDAAGRLYATSIDGSVHRVRLLGPRP